MAISGDWRLMEEITAQVSASNAVLGAGIADVANDTARELGIIQHGRGRDLPGQHHQTRGDKRLARDAAHGVLLKDRIQDGV